MVYFFQFPSYARILSQEHKSHRRRLQKAHRVYLLVIKQPAHVCARTTDLKCVIKEGRHTDVIDVIRVAYL
jgi:hypothetical protein